ncbi:MAG: FAD binding domain-containing protein [Hahellaceae bacterium]|nr:FAD binding domain-containing protein [Hahellaceae bacterium]MCP5168865.1 FAD binding domain-containing protein [Hahellaceae bacterium]
MTMEFDLNGKRHTVADTPQLLIDWLRTAQQQTGTKAACREGDCGSCQVLVKEPGLDHHFRAQPGCLIRVQDLHQCQVLTIEGLLRPDAKPHPLVMLFTEEGAGQCGFCSPALIMASLNWLLHGPALTPEEGEAWLNGNLCRCTGYMGQRRAIVQIASRWATALLASTDRQTTLIALDLLPPYAAIPPCWHSTRPTISEETPEVSIVLGGGTDLYLERPLNQLTQAVPCSSGKLQPPFKEHNGEIWLNAQWPIQALADALLAQKQLPFFSRFNFLFASLPVRNRATLGGNLAHASPIGDAMTLMMALNATLHTNRRSIPVQHLITGFKQTCLAAGELIEWIALPPEVGVSYIHFDKVSRRSTTDIAALNCAGCWHVENSRVTRVRLVIGGASPCPLRLPELEKQFIGLPPDALCPDPTPWLKAALSPRTDHRGSESYRFLLAKQLILAQWDALKQLTSAGSEVTP